MTFENLENIIALVCTIIGLLYCVFKFIEIPKRGYRYLIVFFLADFLSEYYYNLRADNAFSPRCVRVCCLFGMECGLFIRFFCYSLLPSALSPSFII